MMKVAVKVSPRDCQRSGLREIQLENPLLGSMILHFLAIGYDFFFRSSFCDVMCLFSFSSIVVNFVMHRGLANRHPLAQFRE